MRGHVVRRGDAWRVHVYLGRDEATGKQRYLTRTVRGTKREAEKVCATLVVEASRGLFGARASGTLASLLEDYLALIEPDASPSTMATYRGYVRLWILPRLGDKKVDRLRPDDLDRLYSELRKRLSPASVLKVHTILRAALGQAVRWRMLSENPAALASPPRPAKAPIRPPTPEQVARLLAAAEEMDPDLAVYLRLAAVTGARRGELCALRWSDLDLDDGEILIERSLALGSHQVVEKSTKTHRARRIALDPGTIRSLEGHRRRVDERAGICEAHLVEDAYVFARDVEGRTPWRPDSGATGRFEKLRSKVGLETVRLHDLRHYVATRLQLTAASRSGRSASASATPPPPPPWPSTPTPCPPPTAAPPRSWATSSTARRHLGPDLRATTMTQPPRRRWRFYETLAGRRPVRDFLDGLSGDDLAAVAAAMRDIARNGLVAARHVRGDIYEIREDGDRQTFRILFAAEGRRGQVLLALEGFSKKTRRTPPDLIDVAERRLGDWRHRARPHR